MKVEIGARTAAQTIKVLLRGLEIAEAQLKRQDREINRLQFDNEHQAREIKDLMDEVAAERSPRKEYGVILKELQPQMFSIEEPDRQREFLASEYRGVVKDGER